MATILDNPERLKRLVRLEYEQGIASADLGKRSLKQFLKDVWHLVEPGVPFVDGWCLGAICEHMQAVTSGQIRKIVITIPPRHTKSTTISVVWPVWDWITLPEDQFLCASYKQSLAMRDNRRRRNLIMDPWFQRRYGHVFRLASDQKMKSLFENDKKGFQLALSVAGSATGDGGSKLVIDDAHSADDAHSDVQRETAVLWFREVWSNRLNNAEKDAMAVVGQRIHEKDVCGYILRERPDWVHLDLPAEYDPSRKCFTSIGWSDPRTVEGELLWPERFSKSTLDGLKRDLGSIGYASQYQQSPVPAGGAIFKKQWFRYFTETPEAYLLETAQGTCSILKSDCWRFTVVDLAISLKQTADYTVIQTYDVTPQNDLLLIEQIRDHLDNPQQQKILRLLYHRLKPRFLKVESVGYQLALIQELKNEPKNLTDFIVEVASPEALDSTLRQLPGVEAFVVRDDFTHNYITYYGPDRYVVQVLGDAGFFKFAVEKQGYCKIVGQPGVDPSRVSIPVREYKPVKDKVARATTPAIWMENGKFFFRQGDPYLATVEPELLTFPLGGHDDIVDGCSMAADEVSAGISMQALVADLTDRQTAKETAKEKIQKQRNEWFW